MFEEEYEYECYRKGQYHKSAKLTTWALNIEEARKNAANYFKCEISKVVAYTVFEENDWRF